MNLKEWAAGQGVSYATALRWFKAGKLPVPAYQAGRLIVIGSPVPAPAAGSTVVYARVSSADQRPDLDRQVARVTEWVTGQRLPVDRVVTEVGSALNGVPVRMVGRLPTEGEAPRRPDRATVSRRQSRSAQYTAAGPEADTSGDPSCLPGHAGRDTPSPRADAHGGCRSERD